MYGRTATVHFDLKTEDFRRVILAVEGRRGSGDLRAGPGRKRELTGTVSTRLEATSFVRVRKKLKPLLGLVGTSVSMFVCCGGGVMRV